MDYLIGKKWVTPYRIFYCMILPVGAAVKLELVWTISDIFNALMALAQSHRPYFLKPGDYPINERIFPGSIPGLSPLSVDESIFLRVI